MDDDKRLASGVLSTVAASGFGGVAKSLAEAAIDGATTSEVLKAVPAVSTVLAVGKTARRLRDLFLERKILQFLIGAGNLDEESRPEGNPKRVTGVNRCRRGPSWPLPCRPTHVRSWAGGAWPHR